MCNRTLSKTLVSVLCLPSNCLSSIYQNYTVTQPVPLIPPTSRTRAFLFNCVRMLLILNDNIDWSDLKCSPLPYTSFPTVTYCNRLKVLGSTIIWQVQVLIQLQEGITVASNLFLVRLQSQGQTGCWETTTVSFPV